MAKKVVRKKRRTSKVKSRAAKCSCTCSCCKRNCK